MAPKVPLRCLSLVIALACVACGGSTATDTSSTNPTETDATAPDATATDAAEIDPTQVDPVSDAELTLSGTSLELDIAADGRALVVGGGLDGYKAVSWGPQGWYAPIEIVPPTSLEDPSGAYVGVIDALHAVALGLRGEAWVLYSRLTGPLYAADSVIELYARHRPASALGFAVWAPPELVARVGVGVVSDPTPARASLVFSASGLVGVVWSQRDEPVSVRVRDPGGVWGPAEVLDSSTSNGSPPLQINADSSDNVIVVSTNGSGTRSWQRTPQGWTATGIITSATDVRAATSDDGVIRLVFDSTLGLVSSRHSPDGAAQENLSFGANHYLVELAASVGEQALFAYASDELDTIPLDGPVHGLLVTRRTPGVVDWSTPEQYDSGPVSSVQLALNSHGEAIAFWKGSTLRYRRFGSSEAVSFDGSGYLPSAAALAEDGRALLGWSFPYENDLHVRWVE